MEYFDLRSLPKIIFAHIYRADTYAAHPNALPNFIEISYLEDGCLQFFEDGQTSFAKTGDLICRFHRAKYSVHAKKPHCHHTIGMRVDWCFAEDPQQGLLLPSIVPKEFGTQAACDLIDDLIRNQMQYIATPVKGAAKILELICEIDQICRKTLKSKIPSEQRYVQRAKDFIQHNLLVPITLSDVARHLGISPEYLCTVFKKNEGVTIKRYINRMKLERIKALMDGKQLRLYEAATVYGYNDPNYVSRLYKQFFGKNITDSDDQNLQT